MTVRQISSAEYDDFRNFLQKACGIVLGDNKQYLITSRLNRLMNDEQIDTFASLIKKINLDKRLRDRILDAMTTNETSWFRDRYPFEILKQEIFPQLSTQRASQLRIWSAASSTGQEAYSISMTIQEYLMSRPGSLPSNIEIVGTDISPTVLAEANQGRYDSLSMARGLTPERKDRFFKQVADENLWELREDLRKRVVFRELNLLSNYSLLGKFDVVFCRNVLIYFSAELKREILEKIASVLKPNGYLFLGGSESTANYTDRFEMTKLPAGVIYKLRS